MKQEEEKKKQEEEKKLQAQDAHDRRLQDARQYADEILTTYKTVSGIKDLDINPKTHTQYNELKFSYSGNNPDKIRQNALDLDNQLQSYQRQIDEVERQRKITVEKNRQKQQAEENARQQREKEARQERLAKEKFQQTKEDEARQKQFAEDNARREQEEAKRKKQAEEKRLTDEKAQQTKENSERQSLLVALKERNVFNRSLLPFADQYPLSQLKLVVASFNGQVNFNEATNKLAKGATRPARKRELCNLLGGYNAWIGQVSKLDSNNEGKGVLGVMIANDVFLRTHNNAFSDMRAKTLLEPGTAIFEKAITLKRGDIVQFNGYTARDKTDCIDEQSITLKGSMQEPNYTFKFVDITKLN